MDLTHDDPVVRSDRSPVDYDIHPLETIDEQRSATDLYRSVFGYGDDSYAVSPRLLRSLIDNGGSALGAFDAHGQVIGFCYGFTARAGAETFHYSQATVIDSRAQGRGIGRALKLAQAEVARGTGVGTMSWAYDPYLLANAHFNLSSLGARGRSFHEDYYGEPNTDRLVVDWNLDPTAVAVERAARADRRAAVASDIGHFESIAEMPQEDGTATGETNGDRWIVFRTNPSIEEVGRVRASIRLAIVDACADGLSAIGCDTVEAAAPGREHPFSVYVFGRQ